MIHEIVPGFVLSFLAIVAVSLMGRPPAASVTDTFEAVEAALDEAKRPAAKA